MAFGPTHLVHTDAGALAKATASGDKTGSMEPGSRSSAGERLLHTQDVTGSIPVATTSPLSGAYLVRARATRLVKIGKSDCMAARLANLQHHCADRLDLVAIIPSATPLWTEQDLHWQFAKLRRHGEWFAQGKALTAYLESLRDPPDPDDEEDPFAMVRNGAWIYDKLSLYEMNGGKCGKSNRANMEAALWSGQFVPAKRETPPPLTPSQRWNADYLAMLAAHPMSDEAKMALAENVDAFRGWQD